MKPRFPHPRRRQSRRVHFFSGVLIGLAMLCYAGGLFEATAGLVLAGIVLELAAYVAYGSEVAERDRRPDTAADGD